MRSILDTTKAQQECAEAAIEEARSNDSSLMIVLCYLAVTEKMYYTL